MPEQDQEDYYIECDDCGWEGLCSQTVSDGIFEDARLCPKCGGAAEPADRG